MFSCSTCCAKKEPTESGEKPPLIPVRFVQCFLLFLGIAITYALRMNLSISIVAMTDRNATDADVDIYDWNERIKSYVLSSFFYGYIITQIPGGYVAHHFGSKMPIFIGLFACSLLGMLTPLCAKIGDWYLVVGLRAMQGLFQGLLFPSVHNFIAKWAPANERGRLISCVYSGTHVGTVTSLSLGGYIAASPLGWPSNFYFVGIIGVTWSIFWLIFSASTPLEHKTIKASEKEYILLGNDQKKAEAGPPLNPPWGRIFTSVAFYAALVVFVCNSFGFWVLLTQTPTYIHNILNFNIRNNGTLSALPYIGFLCLNGVFIYMNGVITNRQWLSLNFSRKLFNAIGQWTPMVALTIVGCLTTGEYRNWAILLLVISVSANGAILCGSYVNPIDLTPNFAGALMGVLNFFGNLMSMSAPLIVGVIVTDEKNPAQWRIIFYMAAAFYLVGNPLIPVRFWQCFLLFTGMAILYALRVNLSISIVAMTNRNATDTDVKIYDWDERVKSYILSSFFWGYLFTQIPGGYFSHKFGAKLPLLVSLSGCSVLAILTPLCAEIGNWYLISASRALQGLFQGVTFPSVQHFISKWSPTDERGGYVAFVYSGLHLGTVLMLSAGGFIAASWFRWPSNFYLPGILGLIWAVFWFLFAANKPTEYKHITDYEKEYILSSQHGNDRKDLKSSSSSHKLPLRRILTCPAFYALLFPYMFNSFGFWMLLTEIPTYIDSILNFDIQQNGPLSGLPYFFYFVLCFVFIWMNHLIEKYKLMTLDTSRKFFNTIGQCIPAIALAGLGFLTTSNWSVILLIIAVSSNAAVFFGIIVNQIDLSPNFAGHLMGIMNTGGNLMDILAPLMVGFIVTDEKNPAQWRIVFFIAASLYFIGSMLFITFGRTDVQSWNDPDNEDAAVKKT